MSKGITSAHFKFLYSTITEIIHDHVINKMKDGTSYHDALKKTVIQIDGIEIKAVEVGTIMTAVKQK